MRFTTLTFIVFFILFYLIYWSLKGRSRLALIVLSSLVFYAAWSVYFAMHFFIVVLINYYFVGKLHENRSRVWLSTILIIDTANLFLFKYFYLFLEFLHDISGIQLFDKSVFNAGLEETLGIHQIFLPLAISFYTFQLMAYVTDVYRGHIEERTQLLDFCAFILFFPQLVAGPIMRHSDFFYQLKDIRPDPAQSRDGMYLVLQGITKKVLIADNLIAVVNPIYAAPWNYDGPTNFMAVVGFAARVYCDFSGYTDIARGLGKMLGLNLPENFRGPYLSTSLREFWTRWHISLSTWMRDYLYIPLGGSRQTELRNNFVVVSTFTLAGLWHGANYTFILWGFFNGVLLVFERRFRLLIESYRRTKHGGKEAAKEAAEWARNNPALQARLLRGGSVFIRNILTQACILTGLVAFNSPDIHKTFAMLGQIFTWAGAENLQHSDSLRFLAQMMGLTYIFSFMQTKKFKLAPNHPWLAYTLLAVLTFILVALLGRFSPQGVDFIYFDF